MFSDTTADLSEARSRSYGDRYLLFLCTVLVGYAVLGKGFAYLGLSPLFIGEIALLTGAVVFLRTGLLFAVLTTTPSLLLALLMAWALLRTIPFVAVHGMDALRDSVIIMYGGFAYVVAAVLLQDSRRLEVLLDLYGRFLRIYVPIIPFLFGLSLYFKDWLPNVPGTDVPIIQLGPAEVPVHLTGAAVFAIAGFYRPSALWLVAMLAAVAMGSALTRGGMLAFIIPVFLAALVSVRLSRVLAIIAVGAAVFAAAYAAEKVFMEPSAPEETLERQLTPSQLLANAQSLLGHSDPKLEGSRRWRLEWWDLILRDTWRDGPHYWNGRGFGLNLAVADGFSAGRETSPLRSPHNAHMTILARTGVPGLVVWLLFLTSWLGMMAGAFWDARRRGEREWAGTFLFVGCYALACVINATFDVAFEGPMQGVWFWCLIGIGLGAVMVFRFRCLQLAKDLQLALDRRQP